jgi:hypothetical protein
VSGAGSGVPDPPISGNRFPCTCQASGSTVLEVVSASSEELEDGDAGREMYVGLNATLNVLAPDADVLVSTVGSLIHLASET